MYITRVRNEKEEEQSKVKPPIRMEKIGEVSLFYLGKEYEEEEMGK